MVRSVRRGWMLAETVTARTGVADFFPLVLTRGFDGSRFGIVEEFPCLQILEHGFLLTKPRCIVIHPHKPNSTRIPPHEQAAAKEGCEKPTFVSRRRAKHLIAAEIPETIDHRGFWTLHRAASCPRRRRLRSTQRQNQYGFRRRWRSGSARDASLFARTRCAGRCRL